jgi:uridine kinase
MQTKAHSDSGSKSRSSRKSLVKPGAARRKVQARLEDGTIWDAPPGTLLNVVLKKAAGRSQLTPVAAIVNGKLKELTAALHTDSIVRPLTLADSDGMRIYRRSLSFLMLTAAAEIYPEAEIYIEHSATTTGAYYCEVRGRRPFDSTELLAISEKMREIAAADEPIRATQVSRTEAISLFQSRGEEDKARLLNHREKQTIRLYELRGRKDHLGGFMVPSTGCLKYFALHTNHAGFMLQFPHQNRPTVLAPIKPYPKLFAVFEESGHWLDRLGIRNAGTLNDAIVDGRLPEVSLVAEALHEARIAGIAADIASRRDGIRVICIAGPSASGKTTFSKRLAVQLLANGLRPFPLSLDDYFVERERTPKDENNEYNYETIKALDLDLFNDHLKRLIDGCQVQLPRYVFKTGRREAGPIITLDRKHVVIVEGIHGLNPQLIQGVEAAIVFRIYVSALTHLNLDRHNRINTTDCRLIRRIVRDSASRGYQAADTLKRWASVVAGEKQNIFPFQENSDSIFNSALVHEFSILRPLADPLLLQVRLDNPNYLEANRLLSLLQWFRPAGPGPVPDNSILREFIGGSILENFRIWHYSQA